MRIPCLVVNKFLHLFFFFLIVPKSELFTLVQNELFLPSESYNLKPRTQREKEIIKMGQMWCVERLYPCFPALLFFWGKRVGLPRLHISTHKTRFCFFGIWKFVKGCSASGDFWLTFTQRRKRKIKRADWEKRWWFPFLSSADSGGLFNLFV